MFRDEFPDTTAYLSYIGECEDSLGHKYQSAMTTPNCYEDYAGCENLIPCPEHTEANHDGLVYIYYPGGSEASNCQSPMFTLKQEDGHVTFRDGNGQEESQVCSDCDIWAWFQYVYRDDKSFPDYADTPEKAHEWLWKTTHMTRRADELDIFNCLNGETGLKKETHPDYTLSERARNP